MMSSGDDRALVEAFVSRRSDARFRTLYRAHTPSLYRMALTLLGPGSRPDAEDAVQETWIRAIRQLERFEWRSSLRTWLVGILINCVRESSRRRRRSEPGVVSREPAPLESSLDLEVAIAGLAEGARLVFCLHDIEGYTHKEIGELLKISDGTSKSQLSTARCQLRKRLGGKP